MQSGRGLYPLCMEMKNGENRYELAANTRAKLAEASGSKR